MTEKIPVLLVVDDGPDNLFVIEQLVNEYIPGCIVHTAAKADIALQMAQELQPDGILSDIQMPGKNGIELCRLLKQNPKTSHIPVLLITAHQSDPNLRVQGLEAGADDFIARPIDNLEFVARIKVMFRIKYIQDELIEAKCDLENRVAQRTKELYEVNLSLREEVKERKQAEEEKAILQDQLLQSQKMEAVGQLAGGVAHDFNNMLGVIIGHAELAMDQVDEGQPIHYDLVEIDKAAHRSADLTRQLLTFARKQVISPKVIDLNETVEGILNMLRRLIGEDIDLTWQPSANAWSVKFDPSQIDQLLANLCVNARDAIAGVGKVTVETRNISFDEGYCAVNTDIIPGEYVMIAVSDDGCGMSKEILSRIFEPFFTTKGLGKGTGLGLATVYGVVKQNNGFIDVYSEPDEGTTFRIYIPRHICKEATETKSEGLDEPLMRGQETILVVEDDPALLNLNKKFLEPLGYRVFATGSPGEAIRLAEVHAGEIHMLMTDVVMPEMNGRDLAEKMLILYPGMRCLFTSGYTSDVIAKHGVLDEGVYFIQKPFSREDLVTKVRKVLVQK